MDESQVIKDILTTASPLIKSVVDTFVTPKLESFRDRNKIEKGNQIPTDNHFSEYFYRTYKKAIVINTLVFNNSQRLLTDIYIPLTITNTNDRSEKVKISGFPEKISDEYGNILITDTAGMGKSTMMKSIFIDCIHKGYGIPILIELRRISRTKTILEEIIEQLNSIDKNFDKELLLQLLAEGGFIFILDGFDEIVLRDREVVTIDIQNFIEKADKNRFFITSRPEKALLSFGNFQEFKIQPLTRKEAFELLRKYDRQGTISTLLIKKLQDKDLQNISEFLTNPLLVSLLFTAFEHKQSIPFKKYLFYRQVYDANFENHDLTKGDSYIHDKYSKLEIDDFHRVLRHLGYQCIKIQQIEFTKDELLKIITNAKEFCVGISFKESDFLTDLLKTVPLFSQDGNYYRWSHKSLQEYFAAQFIYLDSKENQKGIMEKLYNSSSLEKYINVLDLYYDMDYKTFREVIEYNLLIEFREFCNENYNELKPHINEELLTNRLEMLFTADCFIFLGSDELHDFGQKINEMIRNFPKEKIKQNGRFSGTFPHSKTEKIHGINCYYPKNQIITLLANKQSKLVKEILRDNENSDYTFDECNLTKSFELMELPQEKDACLNSEENFEQINNVINNAKTFRYILNYKNAFEELAAIEKEINLNRNIDLSDGL